MYRLEEQLTIGDAAKLVGVAIETLRRWEKAGKIKAHRTEGGHRRYLVADLLKIEKPEERFTVTYSRVSTKQRESNLKTQSALLVKYCSNQGWDKVYHLQDIGSGLNYKKRGLLKLIDLLQRNEVERLIITDKDRLLRFGSEIIFALCENNKAQIIILNQAVEREPEVEMAEDIMSILTVFSARLYGRRSRRNLKAMKTLHKTGNEILDNYEIEEI